MPTDNQIKEWHLDRKVTMALILAVSINAGSSIWWAATLTSQVQNQQKQIELNSKYITENRAQSNGVSERLTRVEANQLYMTKILERMARK